LCGDLALESYARPAAPAHGNAFAVEAPRLVAAGDRYLRPLGVLDGNTFLETLTGPVIVALWAGASYLIDRRVVRIPDQNGTGPSI
jgi:hypothetical protein